MTPTQGEHAQTEALRPKFGDLLRNTMASERNPRRDAYFIREVHRSGRWFEMTDGKGETWLSNPQNMVPAASAHPAADSATPDGEPSNVELRGMWYGAGGTFHGPNVETGTMPEAKLLPFLRSLASGGQAPAGAAQWAYSEIEERIKELMAGTAYPESMGVAQAMKQLVNELWQRYGRLATAQAAPTHAIDIKAAAQAIAVEVAKNCGSVPQLTFPHIYLGLQSLFTDAPTAQAAPAAERENLELRRMLCIAHAGAAAYMDDGEAQDNRELPLIDFLHDTPAEIQDKLQRRALKKLAAQAAAPAPAAQADSVLEDAMGLVNDIDTHMRSEWSAGRLPAVCWPLAFSDRIKALRAARKQGGKHD